MFQFLLAEVAYAWGHGVFPCAIWSHLVSKGKDGVPQKGKFEKFWTWFLILEVVYGLDTFSVVIVYLSYSPVCNERIYISFHNSGRSYWFLWLGLK